LLDLPDNLRVVGRDVFRFARIGVEVEQLETAAGWLPDGLPLARADGTIALVPGERVRSRS
jgi:hypothetical protein